MAIRGAVATAWRRYAGSQVAVWATVLAVFLLLRLVLIVTGTVFDAPDSAVYAPREDPARNHGALVSLTGDAPRPWGLPAFYALFGSDTGRAWGQWALATVAWVAFAREATQHLRTRAARLALGATLLLFACLAEVASWDLAILTESLSISLGLLVLALLLRWLRTGAVVALGGMALVAVWWTFVRPDIRVFSAVLVALLLAIAAGRGWRRWRPASRPAGGVVATQGAEPGNDRSPRRGLSAGLTGRSALVGAAVLVGAIGWYAAVAPGMAAAIVPYDRTALRPDPLPAAEAARVFRLRVDVSTDARLWAAFRAQLGMPACPELEALRAVPEWREQEWARAYTRCPELVAWVRARTHENFWAGLARQDPGLFLRTFGAQASLTLGGEHYASVGRVVPAPAERLVFPSRQYGLPVAVGYFAVALGLAVWAGAHRARRPAVALGDRERGPRRLFWTAVGLFVVAVGSAAATVAVHTGELGRYGVQEAYATRVAVILLLGCALDAYLVRRGGQVDNGCHASPSSSSRLSSTR